MKWAACEAPIVIPFSRSAGLSEERFALFNHRPHFRQRDLGHRLMLDNSTGDINPRTDFDRLGVVLVLDRPLDDVVDAALDEPLHVPIRGDGGQAVAVCELEVHLEEPVHHTTHDSTEVCVFECPNQCGAAQEQD